jgi:FkbM family methyltransferase
MYLGIDEPWIAKLAQSLIKPGDVVYDIGAHIGYTCLLFAQSLAGTGAVHAFEILPSTVELLKKTVGANEFNNITVHNIGLGLRTQTVQLAPGPTAMTGIYSAPQEDERTELCKIISLDQYVNENKLPPPSLIKIDIECAEIDCLRGGYELINKYKPKMLVEFHALCLLKEGHQLLESWGYRLIAQDATAINTEQLGLLKSFHKTVLCLPN